MSPQSALVRFAFDAESGEVVRSRTAPGRGAWICEATESACVDLAWKRGAFARAFRRSVQRGP